MKKRVITVIFAVLMILGITPIHIPAQEALAVTNCSIIENLIDAKEYKNTENPEGMILIAEDISAELVAGNEVRVPVRAELNAGYVAGILDIEWNRDVLELSSVEYTELAPRNNSAPISNKGKYRLSFGKPTAKEDFKGTGTFFILFFKITSEAVPGDYEIKLSSPDIVNNSIANVETSLLNGSVRLYNTTNTTTSTATTSTLQTSPTTSSTYETTSALTTTSTMTTTSTIASLSTATSTIVTSSESTVSSLNETTSLKSTVISSVTETTTTETNGSTSSSQTSGGTSSSTLFITSSVTSAATVSTSVSEVSSIISTTVTTSSVKAAISIDKLDKAGEQLQGARLKLTGTKKDGITQIEFSSDSISVGEGGILVNATGNTIVWINGISPTIVFIEDGVYTLHEEVAPVGFLIADDIVFAVSEGKITINDSVVGAIQMIDEMETSTSTSDETTTASSSTTTTFITETSSSPGSSTLTTSTSISTSSALTDTTTITEQSSKTSDTSSTTSINTSETSTSSGISTATVPVTTTSVTDITGIESTSSSLVTTTIESEISTVSTSKSVSSESSTNTTFPTTTTEPVSSTTTEIISQPEDIDLGDVNSDGKIDAKDASMILVEYAKMSTGGEEGLSEKQHKAANVNNDSKIDAKDASYILAYYSLASTSSESVPSMKEFMIQNI